MFARGGNRWGGATTTEAPPFLSESSSSFWLKWATAVAVLTPYVFLGGLGLFAAKSECYWLLGLAVGDGVAAGGGAGVTFQASTRFFQVPPSRRYTSNQ